MELKIRGGRSIRRALEAGHSASEILAAARERGTWTEGEIVEAFQDCGIPADFQDRKCVLLDAGAEA